MRSDALALIRADLLKLRRRRGLIALALALAVGSVALIFTVTAIRHGSDPLHNGPAGGIKNFEDAIEFVGVIGVVVAAMIGATAGAGDAEAGVLRDLVATGRSRLALFGSRAAAAITVTLGVLAAALTVTTVCSITLAGSLPAPSLTSIVQHVAGVLAFGATSTLVAVGISTFARSRGPVIAVVIALGVLVSQLLIRISFLGNVRAALPLAAFERMVGEVTPGPGLHLSLATAIAVTVAWALAAVLSGAWWARRVEV
jgi:ABC-type transport system involved in multi-copper enzyme maturation permease subunit